MEQTEAFSEASRSVQLHMLVHIPDKEKRSKLDEKEEKGIYLDHSDESKAYRVYN